MRATRVGVRDELVGESALADSRLTGEQEEAPAAGEGIIKGTGQLRQLALPAHERTVRGLHAGLGRYWRLGRCKLEARVLDEDRALELMQSLAGLDAQLLD